MKPNRLRPQTQTALFLAATFLVAVLLNNTSQAYDTYSGGSSGGCIDCHGDFRGPTSTKGTIFPGGKNHDMHRNAAYMATGCNICHTGTSHTPVYTGSSNGTNSVPGLGCSGCHVKEGLRAHHLVNGVTVCLDCHADDAPSVPESVKPPYYGTNYFGAAYTKANNPGNTLLATNINENWSVGDFLGLDNDGNNLYDLADYDIGPFQVLSLTPAGNNVSVKWVTAGGRTNWLQAAGTVAGTYANVSPALAIPGVGLVTNTYVEVNGATNKTRFYRLNGSIP